ncbi:BTAD domain-containing putative transcriptional regulator [Streptomyces sp. NPDC047072]|uniref:AfsR/SARP family transcriptional regulator n=1 Tax=Streptomyces sp. NPDC047072 TaxID=3154809 RepID=UPI0033F5848C
MDDGVRGEAGFAILGPLEVRAGGVRLRLGGPIQARVLTTLLLDPCRMVPVSRLVEAAWDDEPPATAAHQVRKAIADLRQRIPGGPSMIVTDGPGYRVDVARSQLDLSQFSDRLCEARDALEAGHLAEAAELLRTALVLWRGPVLPGGGGSVIAAASVVLEERRLAAVEQLMELRLALGESRELIGDLRELVAEHPLGESFRGQLMLALYRSGRQAEALAEFAKARELLIEELGIDPGPQLTRLHEAILRDSPELAVPDAVSPESAVASAAPAASGEPEPEAVAAPCTLPHDLTDFAGRDRELTQLLEYAAPPRDGAVRIVAVDGMGGSGKTALVVRGAHRLADRYPDGQLFVDLRGFTPGEQPMRPGTVIGTLLRTLGVPGERIPDDLDGRVALWRTTLANRRVLLVLDNAADAAQIRPLLPSHPGSLGLLTSRIRMVGLDGAEWMSIGTMSPSDSLALITGALGEERVLGEPEAAAELAALCGNLPLALRIATARLRNRPLWTLGHLVGRLGDETRRLDELKSGDRSVEATLRMSYHGLDARHREAFRLLGLHPGAETDTHSAAALLDTSSAEAEEVLEHLLDMHLVEQHEIGRYTFHDLVRSFAQRLREEEGADAGQERAAFGRLLDHFLTVTDQACAVLYPGRVPVGGGAHASGGDGRGTTAVVAPPGGRVAEPSSIGQIAEPPSSGQVVEAESFFEREHGTLLSAVARAERLGFLGQTVHLSRNLVFHLNSRSCLEEYRQAATIAVAAARRLGDPVLLRVSLSNLGSAWWRLGRFREGIPVAEEALGVAKDHGDRNGEAVCLSLLGLLHSCLGHFPEAQGYLEQAVERRHDMADGRQGAYAWCSLSTVYTWLGRYREAAVAAEHAVRLSRELGARAEEITALTDLTAALLGTEEYPAARAVVERALELGDELRMPEEYAHALALAADVSQWLGAGEESAGYAERALHLIRSKGTATRQATVQNILGRVHCRRGEFAQALELHRSARFHAGAIEYRIEVAQAVEGMAEALDGLGDVREAAAHRLSARELYAGMTGVRG